MRLIFATNLSLRDGVRLSEQGDDFVIGDLRKILIELANGPEFFGGEQINQVVAPAAYLRHPIRGDDRNGDDELVRVSQLRRLQCGDHG